MSSKSKPPTDGGAPPPQAQGTGNPSDVPVILYVGTKIVEAPYTKTDYEKLVENQMSIVKDTRALEEVRPTLKQDVADAETELRRARADERLNEACINESMGELMRVAESAQRGILRSQRTVREEFLRGQISVYEVKTGELLTTRNATAKEQERALELRDKDGKPMSGLLEPEENELAPLERAKRKLASEAKKNKKDGDDPAQTTGKILTFPGGGPPANQEAPAPTPRGKRGPRPVPTSIQTPPPAAAPPVDPPPPA